MKIRDLSREKPFAFAAWLSACIFLIAILMSVLVLYLATRDTDSFGVSLALDDDTMVLSIHSAQKAYVLQREGNGWVLQSEISPKSRLIRAVSPKTGLRGDGAKPTGQSPWTATPWWCWPTRVSIRKS